MYNKISTLRYWCQKVMPLVYDDSLSYLETLGKFSAKLNEVIETTNGLAEQYQDVGETLEEATRKLNELDNKMETFITDIQREFEALETNINVKVDNKLEDVERRVSAIETSVNAKIDELEVKVTSEISQATIELTNLINTQLKVFDEKLKNSESKTKTWVENELNDFLSKIPEVQNVMVIDPTTGKLTLLQVTLDNLYDMARVNALTAQEYDGLLLSANEYDRTIVNGVPRGLTANEYDSFGRRYLWRDTTLFEFSAFTGRKESLSTIMAYAIDLFKVSGSYTASEYDSIGKTASEYDALSLSAYNYDWHANVLIA